MSIFGSILAAAAGPLVGGLLKGRQQDKAQAAADARQSARFTSLVKDAKRAGFNPLTALRADGASVAPTVGGSGALSSADFISEAISGGLDTWFNKDQKALDEAAAEIKLETMKEELSQLKSKRDVNKGQTFGFDIPTAVTAASATYNAPPEMAAKKEAGSLGQLRPKARPTFESAGSIPVFLPTGDQATIPRRAAERLQLKPWDAMIAGDVPELLGEIPGEGANAIASSRINSANGNVLFGGTPPPKADRRDQQSKRSRPDWYYD